MLPLREFEGLPEKPLGDGVRVRQRSSRSSRGGRPNTVESGQLPVLHCVKPLQVEVARALFRLGPESTADLLDVLLHHLGLEIKDMLEEHPIWWDADKTLAQRDEAREMRHPIGPEMAELGTKVRQNLMKKGLDRQRQTWLDKIGEDHPLICSRGGLRLVGVRHPPAVGRNLPVMGVELHDALGHHLGQPIVALSLVIGRSGVLLDDCGGADSLSPLELLRRGHLHKGL